MWRMEMNTDPELFPQGNRGFVQLVIVAIASHRSFMTRLGSLLQPPCNRVPTGVRKEILGPL